MSTELDRLEAMCRETCNPLYVFDALSHYDLCPDDAPLPTWIMQYLRDAAMTLVFIADTQPPSQALKQVSRAFGLNAEGRKNQFAAWKLDNLAKWADYLHGKGRDLFGKDATAKDINAWLAKASKRGVTAGAVRKWRERGKRLKNAPK